MKRHKQLTLEEFRSMNNLTVDQIVDELHIPVSKYGVVKHNKVIHYSHCPLINSFLITEVRKELIEKWRGVIKEAEELDERSFEHLCNLVESFMNIRKKKTTKALV
ncbi:hypothetical protein FOA24_06800 [Bacillus thuringiensis]|uniref:hypothetical protein n=1 Tax=Bacillus thuringiensis TaxID=1428 RepID=UPI00333761B3